MLTRSRSSTLRAAKLVGRSAAPRQIGGVIARFAPGAILWEGMNIRAGSG
jgi:alkylated DNA nucleotide flippase Atl1